MAGRENQGELWDLAAGLDLQPPIVCAGFRTLSNEKIWGQFKELIL